MPDMKAASMNPALPNLTKSDNGISTDILKYTVSEVIDAIMKVMESDSVCTCEARVICTSATENSAPHHMKNGDGLIHMGNIEELNKTNIEICENFEGCTKSPDGKCYIAEKFEEWIGDKEWKEVDESSSQGEGKEKLNKDTSYMVCVEYGGIIYFCDDGQELQSFISGEAILYLSNGYLEWLEKAEEFINYPHRVIADNSVAQSNKTVTLGIGFTFNEAGGLHWEILHDVLGWTDEQIQEIINEIFTNGKDYSKDPQYNITHDQAVELVMEAAKREYMPNLNAAIKAYNTQQNQLTTYSQRELEAMFDYSYVTGLSINSADNMYSTSINDQDQIIYYYLRKDQIGAVNVVKNFNSDKRRRLNQMNLFFNPIDIDGYDFLDKTGTDLDPLRQTLGF